MLFVFCLERRIFDRDLTVGIIAFLFIYIQLGLLLSSLSVTAALHAFGELELELFGLCLKSIGNKELWHIMRQSPCAVVSKLHGFQWSAV